MFAGFVVQQKVSTSDLGAMVVGLKNNFSLRMAFILQWCLFKKCLVTICVLVLLPKN